MVLPAADAREKRVLARLSVFVGGFDLAAAEEVCGAEPLGEGDVLDILRSLVEKSLVMAYLSRKYAAKILSKSAPEKAGRSRNSSKIAAPPFGDLAPASRIPRSTSTFAGRRRSLEYRTRTLPTCAGAAWETRKRPNASPRYRPIAANEVGTMGILYL